jgi:predicted unusual protein kinase regulating ubiquinone biosynthesis (AarF/ABC1/UbiB family)
MRKEVDLTHEAKNAEETARFLQTDRELREKVSVPKVEWKWTGESVMTAECVLSPPLLDEHSELTAPFLSMRRTGSSMHAD